MRLSAFLLASALVAGAAHAQDPAAILAANKAATGGAAWDGKAAVEVAYAYSGQGMTGVTGSIYDLTTGAFVDSQQLGPVGGVNGFDGQQAWMKDMSGAVTPEAGGDGRQLAVNEAYRDANLWWRPDFGGAKVVLLAPKTDGGKTYDVLSITPVGGKAFEAWFDTQTHLLARTVEPQGPRALTVYYSDYRPTDGALIAGKQVIDDGSGEQYRQTQTLTEAKFVPARAAEAYAAPKWTNTDSRIANQDGRTTVPFQLINNHIYAPVKVNGKGPYLFIFDTGGQDLLTPDTAKALAVASQGAAAGGGAGEGVVDVGFSKGVTFQIGDLSIKDQTIAVVPFEAAPVEGFDEQGMIGFEVFRRFVTQIDYNKGTLTFIDPAKFDPKDAGTPVSFAFYNTIPQAKGSFEGIPGAFDIDTGSRVELTLTKPFVAANGLMAKHPKGVSAVDGWGVGGRSTSYVTRAATLTLGTVKIDNLVAGFGLQSKGAFADPSYAGNVGSGLLKRFMVTFDYANRIMYLKALPAPTPDAATFDRAGFWINTSTKGFKIVDLTAGGAASAAGLKVGDEITAVDGAPASTVQISDLRMRLRNDPPGTVVKLSVASPAGDRDVALTLKDQI
jgi:hypothetical protein